MKKDSFESYHEELERKAALENAKQEPFNKKEYLKSREQISKYVKEKAQATRRSFLEMAGKAGISSGLLKASPFIAGALAGQHARAAGNARRVIYYYIPGGSIPGTWMPSGSGSMGTVTKPFADVSDVCHFREVDVKQSGHSSAAQALGAPYQGAKTIDNDIADVLSAAAPYKNIYCASELKGQAQPNLFSSAGTPFHDPYDAIAARFNGTLPTPGGEAPPFEAAFNAQLKAIENIKAKLPSEDHDRVQEHADAISALIRRLENQVSADPTEAPSIEAPSLPSQASLYDGDQANFIEHTIAQADVIVNALAAGITNVGLLQVFHHLSESRTSFEDGTVSGGFHNGLQHASPGGSGSAFARVHTYLNTVPAHIIRRLKNTKGPEGENLINSTALVQLSCMGSIDHSSPNSPFLLATNIPEFKSGFSNDNLGNSASAKQIHETVANGLGVSTFSSTAGGILRS